MTKVHLHFKKRVAPRHFKNRMPEQKRSQKNNLGERIANSSK